MSRFYTQDKIATGQTITLNREESHHLAKVLRMKAGDSVQLIDGNGLLAEGKIVEDSRNGSVILVESLKVDHSTSRVSLAFGISKSSALEVLIRRTTEIGVKSFQPLLTQHSLHPDSWNEERWNKLIHEVCKQCELLTFPKLLPPLKLSEWLVKRNKEAELVYSYENSRNDQLQLSTEKDVELLIGSEGGFSEEEIRTIQNHNAKSLGLGKNKLRVETASLVALVLVKQKLGEI